MKPQFWSVPSSVSVALLRRLAPRHVSLGVAFCAFLIVLATSASPAKAILIELDSANYLPLSARLDERPAAVSQVIMDGDSYKAAGYAYDAFSNQYYFLDDFPDEHTFGTEPESAGQNLYSLVDKRIVAADLGSVGMGDHLIQVNYLTVDSSPLVPANESGFTSLSLSVGTIFDGPDDWIDFESQNGFEILDSGFAMLSNGNVLALYSLDPSVVGPEHSLGGLGEGFIDDVRTGMEPDFAGFPVDELVIYWDIQTIPEPSSALLSLIAGLSLVAVRRRKRGV